MQSWASLGFRSILTAGDACNRLCWSSFVLIVESGSNGEAERHRIEHAQILSHADISRFAPLHVVAAMQPTHATSDSSWVEDHIGYNRTQGSYAWRTLLNTGARLALGSDFTVERPNPFLGLYAAVTRKRVTECTTSYSGVCPHMSR